MHWLNGRGWHIQSLFTTVLYGCKERIRMNTDQFTITERYLLWPSWISLSCVIINHMKHQNGSDNGSLAEKISSKLNKKTPLSLKKKVSHWVIKGATQSNGILCKSTLDLLWMFPSFGVHLATSTWQYSVFPHYCKFCFLCYCVSNARQNTAWDILLWIYVVFTFSIPILRKIKTFTQYFASVWDAPVQQVKPH